MENQFTEKMFELSDDELTSIIENLTNLQPLEIEAAEKEIKRRENLIEQFSKYDDDELLKFNNFKKATSPLTSKDIIALKLAEEEAKDRGIRETQKKPFRQEQQYSSNFKSESKTRYSALKTISLSLMVFAWIIGIGSSILIIYMLTTEDYKILSLVALLFGGFFTLILAATSQLIKIFIDIERNTRKTSEKNDKTIP